jgi:phytoene desaturase
MAGKKVIVIGAGIGGLSAAIQLAYRGFSVSVLEKTSTPGGKIIQFKKNGFTFDAGASFITLSRVYRDWFTSVERTLEDYITFTKMSDTTTFRFHNGKTLTLSTNYDQVRNRIAKEFPGEEEGFDRFMKISKDVYYLLYDGPAFARRNYHKLWGFDFVLNPSLVLELPKLHFWESWKQVVDRCFTSPELRAVFSYQASFMGMRPSEALGTYSFFPWAEIDDGMYTVQGGVYGIVEGFVKLAKELGVQFVYDAEVTKLNYENDKLESVTTPKGKFAADIFVSNADGAWFYTHLMPEEKNKTYTEDKIKSMDHTNSYFTINLGLKQPVKKFSHHTFFVAKNWNDYFEKMFEPGSVPKLNFANTCYYFMQKSLQHPEFAPKGKAVGFILVPVCGYDPAMDWNKYENTFKNFIYDMMEQRDGIPIRNLIEEEIIYSPARWGREFNLWENVILSFSLNFTQANGFRMPNKSQEFKNLYFAGSATIPGPGVPTCITSGELVAQRIQEDLS